MSFNCFIPFEDREIYSILPENRRYKVCDGCMCVSCAFLRGVCKICFLCEFKPAVFNHCDSYFPLILSREPFLSYLKEMDRLNGYEPPKFRKRHLDLL